MTESPYERALGEEFERLHPRLRERYGLTSDEGRACVGRGRMEVIENAGPHVRPALWLGTRRNLLFPETGRDVPVTIRNYAYRDDRGRETVSWLRSFETDPPRRFDAAMTYDPERDVVVDYLGAGGRLAVDLHFEVSDGGGLRISSTRQRLRVGGREIPVPAALGGAATVEEWYDDAAEEFGVSVTVSNPVVGTLFRYRGTFEIEWEPIESVPDDARPRRGST